MNERGSKWYRMTSDDVLRQLRTDAACGLSRKVARSRIKRYGYNTLFDADSSNHKRLFRMIIPDFACILMVATVLLSLFFTQLGTALLGVTVAAITVLLIAFLFHRIRKVYAEIARYRVPSVTALRSSRFTSVSARRTVCGDVILLKAGDIVPADCRLITSDGLRVLTLMPNEKGAPVYRELPKNAETLYPYGSTVYAPEHENMLYGGSEVLRGEARAVVVETGKHTYLGAMTTFRIPAEVHTGECGEDAIKELRGYLRFYGFLMLAVLLVLSIVGVLTSPSDVSVLDVFYPLCVVCGTASPMLLLLYFRFVAMQETVALMRPSAEENRAVIKVGRTVDRMNTATDLFLLGHKAFSDGILHFHSAFVGGAVLECSDPQCRSALPDLCESFVLLNRASVSLSRAAAAVASDGALLRELSDITHFDNDALQIRLVRVSETPTSTEGLRCVDVQTNAKSFSLLFSLDPELAERCRTYEEAGRCCAFSDEMRRALRAYCDACVSNACYLITVVRKNADGTLSLVGILSARERIQSTLSKNLKSFSQSSIRLSFFLGGAEKYENAFANACGLPAERIVRSEETPHLTEELLNTYRVFIGFSNDEVVSALQAVQKQRHGVGVLCGNAEDRRFLNAAAFTVVCESTPYHKKGTEETVCTDSLDAGREVSSHAAQSMRRHADAVILRATPEHGGLATLTELFFACRATGYRMRALLSYLISVNMLRVFVAVFCTLLGVGLPAGGWMLYSCWLLDALAIKWIISLRIPRGYLSVPMRINERVLDKQIFSRDRWLPMLISVCAVSLYVAVWRWFGVISQEMAHAPILIVLLLAQLWILHTGCARDGVGHAKSLFRSPALLLTVPLVLLIPLSILIPAVGAVTGLGAWHPAVLIALPIFPLAFFLSRYFLGFFKRTTK